MEILQDIAAVRDYCKRIRKENKSIGLVPTMGYLHEGHLTLMRHAKAACDVVVASVFVNPIQFGPGEDFEEYPRDLARDAELAAQTGVDVIFAPTPEEMYPRQFSSYVDVSGITERLCGASRPGHFRGVATVVSKLFNIVQPDQAFFGQKDAQQVAVIKRMVEDLNINVRVVAVPIVREKDGLAMSSRNVYLNEAERKAARVLARSLRETMRKLQAGERDAGCLRAWMHANISAEPLSMIEYISISDLGTLEEVDVIVGPVLVALAVRFGRTRLIDNLIWGE